MPPLGLPASHIPSAYVTIPQKRKRSPKAAIACETCRRLKLKCDEKQPCSLCARKKNECVYRDNSTNLIKVKQHSTTAPVSLPTSSTTSTDETGGLQQSSSTSITDCTEDIKSTDTARPKHSVHIMDEQRFIPIAARPSDTPYSNENGLFPQNQNVTNQIEKERVLAEFYSSDTEDPNSRGFGGVNKYTNGTEFYGPAATLAFLVELQSRARSFQMKSKRHIHRNTTEESGLDKARGLSVVTYFHNNDPTASDTLKPPFAHDEYKPHHPSLDSSEMSLASCTLHQTGPYTDIEKECIQLYFANLHLIYYFLDKASFMARCENEMWSGMQQSAAHNRGHCRFPALYNAVVAVGAITAGDDTTVAQSRDRVHDYLKVHSNRFSQSAGKREPTYAPLELAQVYFLKAKSLLGDLFEASSLESMQTLMLMSIFCQYALKPHECYMYSGMAARTALSMGFANEPDISKNPLPAIRSWWCLYYHEMEVCCSLGRETFIREPAYYPVYFAKFPGPMPPKIVMNDNTLFFARANTELASILKRTLEKIYHNSSETPHGDKHQAALGLDESLILWKSHLLPIFDFDNTSLTEPEVVSRRKIVLKLRFYSARILINRPFLVAAAYQGCSSSFTSNIKHCLDASQDTIDLLYETFVNRPFFRTWWYNTAYAFNAITIVLYAIVSHLQKGNSAKLLKAVEKSLKIFQAMDGITVSRRCAELTEEIFEVAKMSVEAQQQQRQQRREQQSNQKIMTANLIADVSTNVVNGATNVGAVIPSDDVTGIPMPQTDSTQPDENMLGNISASSTGPTTEEDFLASLIDPKILDDFYANFVSADVMDQSFFESLDFGSDLAI